MRENRQEAKDSRESQKKKVGKERKQQKGKGVCLQQREDDQPHDGQPIEAFIVEGKSNTFETVRVFEKMRWEGGR